MQATGCAPIVRRSRPASDEPSRGPTPAPSRSASTCPKRSGDFLILDAVARHRRHARSPSTTTSCWPTLAETARLEGAFVCPEGAAGVAAVRRLRESRLDRRGDEVVLLNTGAGIKYPDTVAADPPVLQPGDALPPR